jgi:hypothetical protein
MDCLLEAHAGDTTVKPLQRKLTSRGDVKARSAVLKLKKRHVERLTRLPTKCLATACWDFIVARTPGLRAAPLLDFTSLHAANMECYQHVINISMCATWG